MPNRCDENNYSALLVMHANNELREGTSTHLQYTQVLEKEAKKERITDQVELWCRSVWTDIRAEVSDNAPLQNLSFRAAAWFPGLFIYV